mmetsp:Transcript_108312/g.305362  ORF Transcript_108312/g.305362 Transcript_108312/m.305362 type:complete len:346 (-) Transcript_108312:2-1039(-)
MSLLNDFVGSKVPEAEVPCASFFFRAPTVEGVHSLGQKVLWHILGLRPNGNQLLTQTIVALMQQLCELDAFVNELHCVSHLPQLHVQQSRVMTREHEVVRLHRFRQHPGGKQAVHHGESLEAPSQAMVIMIDVAQDCRQIEQCQSPHKWVHPVVFALSKAYALRFRQRVNRLLEELHPTSRASHDCKLCDPQEIEVDLWIQNNVVLQGFRGGIAILTKPHRDPRFPRVQVSQCHFAMEEHGVPVPLLESVVEGVNIELHVPKLNDLCRHLLHQPGGPLATVLLCAEVQLIRVPLVTHFDGRKIHDLVNEGILNQRLVDLHLPSLARPLDAAQPRSHASLPRTPNP